MVVWLCNFGMAIAPTTPSPNLSSDLMAWHVDASQHVEKQSVIKGHLYFISENIICTLLGYSIKGWTGSWLDIALKAADTFRFITILHPTSPPACAKEWFH